ncbi:MAG: primosomal protein N' [Alcaligenaceae bacterium]|nr:primosomal protein N' [Alcaligenaceae bacterium]
MADLVPTVCANASASKQWVRVALDVPLPGLYDYWTVSPAQLGDRVIVVFGRRQMIGVVVALPQEPSFDPLKVKEVQVVLKDIEPFTQSWLRFASFAADYYQRPLGEVLLPALPVPLRSVSSYLGKRSGDGPVSRLGKRRTASQQATSESVVPTLNSAQEQAVVAITQATSFKTFLLYGVTGSGKTEVYLHAAAQTLARGQRVLMLVPEINLTPQFEQSLRARLEPVAGIHGVAVLHSALSDTERLRAWLRVQSGEARIVLGTRLAIFAPLDDVGLIVVDEEHDPSYKQQDGLRYSARDLAVWRAHDLGIPIVLGSATPSLESWANVEKSTYQRLDLPARARAVTLPSVRLVDTRRLQLEQGLSPQLLQAMRARLANKEQVLIFLNRRGYAPALHCSSCGWVSQCTRCTTFTVLHRGAARRAQLQCHHCGVQQPVPKACPDCGDQDLQPMGRGTQRIEEHLSELFPEARTVRIDADSTRKKGSAQALFASIHAGEVDILVGTQMVAKGHDFANLGLVGVLNADAMLFSQDFRAPERLFAQLMQVAGRAGRHSGHGEVIVQTGYPEQAVYQALLRNDYSGFARHSLQERQEAALPPFSYQALLSAEARDLNVAIDFLRGARDLANELSAHYQTEAVLTLYDPVPLRIVRVDNMCRAQLLLESTSRPALQSLLRAWLKLLPEQLDARQVRWQLEVDPLEI